MQIAYKAFNKNLQSTMGKGLFQFVPGKWFEEEEANVARSGFHCAVDPLDCMDYYGDWDRAVYWMVLADGDINEDAHGTRLSCTRIRLVRQLALLEYVAAAIDFIAERPMLENNRRVVVDKGEVSKGEKFIIVRGKNPVAKGELGQLLGFAKEKSRGREIEYASIHEVDGKDILPGIWYRADGVPAGEDAV